MNIFKYLKKHPILSLPLWNREVDLRPQDCLERDLNHYVNQTSESTEMALSRIHDVMRECDFSYREAILTDSGREALFDLLLHRQWIAFHAESLRMVKAEENKISGLGMISVYREKIENKVAKQSMDKLLEQFSEETEGYFSELIKERYE